MSAPVARAEGLGRTFGSQEVVRDVTLDVVAGEVLGLIGPNGGGKSTLLLLIAGLITPTAGSVTIGDSPAHELALRHSGQVGLITAEAGLYPLLTGRENLHYFGGLYDLSASEVEEKAAPILAELDVADHLDRPARAYSSGMRQKVSLVRALLLSPSLLLLDEPTANLDPVSTHTIHTQVRAQADRGVAVVLCTHDLHAAEAICDRVAVMQQTLRAVQVLDGARQPPSPGQLYELYTRHVEVDE